MGFEGLRLSLWDSIFLFFFMNEFFIDKNQLKQIAYKVCTIYKHSNTNKSQVLKVPALAKSIISRIYNSFLQNSTSNKAGNSMNNNTTNSCFGFTRASFMEILVLDLQTLICCIRANEQRWLQFCTSLTNF